MKRFQGALLGYRLTEYQRIKPNCVDGRERGE